MKKLLALACAIGGSLIFSSPVAASPPTREPLPNAPFTLRNVCADFIDIEYPVSNEYITTFFDSSGTMVRQQITGHLVGKFTNESNGNSMTANISGPVTIWFYADGNLKAIKGEGPTLYVTPNPVQLLLGVIQVEQSYADDTNNTLLTESHRGNFIDLCAALA